ncbi:MAG: HEAT repeat domain-containing protein [Planctomycetota bacterium]
MRIVLIVLCCVSSLSTSSRRSVAQAPAVIEPSSRKMQASQLDVGAFNDLMLRAVDNSSNNVKRSAPPGSYRVYGRVVDDLGDPVAGVQVMLGSKGGREMYLANFDRTDEQGRFVVHSDRSSKYVFARSGDRFYQHATDGKTDVVISLPEMYTVSFRPLSLVDRFHETLRVNPKTTDSDSGTQPLGTTRVKTKDAIAGRLQLAPGDYRIIGSRHMSTESGQEVWGTAHLGDITVHAEDEQSFSLRQGGVVVSGTLPESASPEKNFVGDIKASLFQGADGRNGTFDVVLGDETTGFRFDAVPPGTYVLEVRTIPKPRADPQGGVPAFRGFQFARAAPGAVLTRQTIEVTDAPIQLKIKPQRESQNLSTTTAQQIRGILQSEHPQPNVSWSWTDVQVSQIIRLTDRPGARAELVRLITSEETPADWRYLALRTLPSMTPLPEDIVSRLAETLHNPAMGRYRGSVLDAIRKMSDGIDAVSIIMPLKEDDDWRLRYSVADALGEIASRLIEPPDEIVATLIEFLDDPHGIVRKEAAGALGVLHSPGATEALKRKIDDPWGPARAMIAWALFECSDEAEVAVAAMIDLLENGDEEGRKEAAYYLRMFDHRAQEALPVLERCLNYTGKPPFNNPSDLAEYHLRGSAERAIEAIEASVMWRDVEPRFELGVASIDPKQHVRGKIQWGTAVDGVQLGLAIESPVQDFVVGERLPIVLLIRNLGAKAVRLEMDRRLPDVAPEVKFSGKRQFVVHSRVLLAPNHVLFDVLPGETCWVAHNGVGLGEAPAEGLWLPYLREPKPAPYSVRQRYRFEVHDVERRTKRRIWLTTGDAAFNVVSP